MSGEKVQTISTILKFQLLLLSTSFHPSGPEEKKTDPAGNTAPFHLLLRPVQFVADGHEASEGCGAGGRGFIQWKEEIIFHVMQVILASEAVDILLLPGKASISVVGLVDLLNLLCPLKRLHELQFTFPCSRTFHNVLVLSASCSSSSVFFFFFCRECACSEVVHLLL